MGRGRGERKERRGEEEEIGRREERKEGRKVCGGSRKSRQAGIQTYDVSGLRMHMAICTYIHACTCMCLVYVRACVNARSM